MAKSKFHISLRGPEGTTFRSFPSSALKEGDPFKTELSFIRKKCAISSKLFFTIDGTSPITDDLTLGYYMSLSNEGTKILNGIKDDSGHEKEFGKPVEERKDVSNGKPDLKHGSEKEKSHPEEREEAENSANTSVSISTFTVQVAGKGQRPQRPNLSLPEKDQRLADLLDSIGKGGLALGTLPGFQNRELDSLKGDYAALAGKDDYIHPSNMKENDWNNVLANNRALYGYCFDFTSKAGMKKAKKRAFKLRESHDKKDPSEGKAPAGNKADNMNTDVKPATADKRVREKQEDTSDEQGDEQGAPKEHHTLPPMPPFYVFDDASVTVAEIQSQEVHTLTKQGFDARAIEFSLKGEYKGVAGSVDASHAKENSTASQQQDSKLVQSIVVSYNFPRVVVELDHDCLELTEECRRDAMDVTTKQDTEKFYKTYGNIFVTSFGLGGCLQSTRMVDSLERSQLDQVKNSTRMSAGISIQSPFASGSFNYAKSSSESTDKGSASLHQEARLTWDARGGDTVLCSNPPLWASTVKDFNLWRLLDQQQIVSLEGLIRAVDVVAWDQLDNPSSRSRTDGDVTQDPKWNEKARKLLMDGLLEPDKSATVQAMKKYYAEQRLDTKPVVDTFNAFMKEKYPHESEMLLTPGKTFGGLTDDQKVGLGLYMAFKGVLRLM